MKFILLLALVGCAVNVQVTAAAAINTFYGTDDAKDRYAADNAAPLSINAAAATTGNIAAAAPYPAADAPNAADAVAKISPSDYVAKGGKKRRITGRGRHYRRSHRSRRGRIYGGGGGGFHGGYHQPRWTGPM